MIHISEDAHDVKTIEQFVQDYNDGDTEMTLPHSIMQLDKPVLMYIISRLLAN